MDPLGKSRFWGLRASGHSGSSTKLKGSWDLVSKVISRL